MKEKIEAILGKYVDTYGFVSLHDYVKKRNALHKSDRYDQASFDEDLQTIITLGLAYPSERVPYKGKGYGILSRYSYGVDYHLVFLKQLELIVKDLEKLGVKAIGEVDSMKIDERFAAALAKMGFLGKNQFLIHPTYGSYLYLATVLIDQKIEETESSIDDCGTCSRCVELCPTNALDGHFHMDRCISYTTQAKIPLEEDMRKHLKKMVYGCDVCQVVCPKNTGIDVHLHKEFEPDGLEQIDLLALLEMTNKEYKEKYKDNASSWKGLLVMKRNAICLLEQQQIKEAIPLIEQQIRKHQDVDWFVQTAKASLQQLKRVD
jgi:epoxyqueuosine reductase